MEMLISKNLGVPYVELMHEGEKKYLCCNGVLFKDSEYQNYGDLQKEYERREKEETLYDYDYAKSTGLLREKKNTQKTEETVRQVSERKLFDNSGRSPSGTDRQEEKQGFSVNFIAGLLGLTSLISGYISTLHTATYLYDYVDIISAWLMSTSVTAYNATAFEVSVIFKSKKRYGLAFVFIILWTVVTLFSMTTTVSVFYDRFNFNETQIAEDNKQVDSNKLGLELLRTKENDLREAIAFKKKDIEYRQEREYATTAVRLELENLQTELQKNLSEQQKLLEDTPEVVAKTIQRKESLFSFLGRLLHIESGIMEFTMSTLSAVFVNLIAPLSLVAVAELKKKKNVTLDRVYYI